MITTDDYLYTQMYCYVLIYYAAKANQASDTRNKRVFTARRYASAVLAVIVCLSVCLSVCPSQVGVVQRWLNLGSD